VVDDDPDILKVMGLVLESEGCIVREASDPREALRLLDGVDVVIVDQRLPAMTGTELVQAARDRGSRSRFLVISGHRASAHEAKSAAADGYLPKPLEVRSLIAEVERLFNATPHEPDRASGSGLG
jgi:two-component system response regulator GlrR